MQQTPCWAGEGLRVQQQPSQRICCILQIEGMTLLARQMRCMFACDHNRAFFLRIICSLTTLMKRTSHLMNTIVVGCRCFVCACFVQASSCRDVAPLTGFTEQRRRGRARSLSSWWWQSPLEGDRWGGGCAGHVLACIGPSVLWADLLLQHGWTSVHHVLSNSCCFAWLALHRARCRLAKDHATR